MKNTSPNILVIPRKAGMNVDVNVLIPHNEKPDETILDHLRNAAKLPSALRVIGLPNLSPEHVFVSGCAIGTTAAIVPGIIGGDINAGFRLITTSAHAVEIRISQVEQAIRKAIPAGENSENIRLHDGDLRLILELGITALADVATRVTALHDIRIESDEDADIRRTDDGGSFIASSGAVSHRAIELSSSQIGTLGGAGHFIDMHSIEGIFDDKIATELGLFKDQVVISFSAGSRALGHQVEEEYVRLARDINGDMAPERGLCHLDAASPEAEAYMQAYACACNFAYVNRQVITAVIRHELRKIIGPKAMLLAFDIPHNTLRNEQHGGKQLWVHRRAAARALPPDDKGRHGSIVLLSGPPGSASYILAAGRKSPMVLNSLNVNAGHTDVAKSGELPVKVHAQRNIDKIARTLVDAGMADIVARLKPLNRTV